MKRRATKLILWAVREDTWAWGALVVNLMVLCFMGAIVALTGMPSGPLHWLAWMATGAATLLLPFNILGVLPGQRPPK